jgi:hypothetical protein
MPYGIPRGDPSDRMPESRALKTKIIATITIKITSP